MVIQSPSLANLNLLDIGEKVKELHDAGVKMLHIDIMDGHYVPNLCFPMTVIRDIRRDYKDMLLDVHLMVDDPEAYIDTAADYGADYISFQADSTPFVRKNLAKIRARGIKAGVAINPSESPLIIAPYAKWLDHVTFMGVEPGVSGQKFMDGLLDHLSELSAFRKENGLDFKIFIDGGMSYGIMEECIRRGADVLITGVYAIFGQEDGIKGAAARFDKMAAAFSEDEL